MIVLTGCGFWGLSPVTTAHAAHTYTLVGGDGGDDNDQFTIAGGQLKTAATFDYDVKNSYKIRVKVDDGKGGTFQKAFIISVNDLTPPTATTSAAAGVSATGATFNGTVNAQNLSTTVTFEYGTDTSYGSSVTADQSPAAGAGDTSVSKAVTGLTPNTLYHYRVKGVNSGGTTHGADMTFTTPAVAPTATTDAAESVASFGATLKGRVNAQNSSTTVTFEYGTDTSYGSTVTADQSPVTGAGETLVSEAITGLSPNTLYHYRVKGVNASGTTNGADMTFTTPAPVPTATTNAASGVSSTGATLNGTVTAHNDSTTVTFEYGTTTAYGTTVAAEPGTVTGSTATAVSKTITGLTNGTLYHYRVVATNSAGTTNGADASFVAANRVIWTGAGPDSNWSTGANWSKGAAPIPTDSVVIDGDKDLTIDGLLVQAATIEIKATYTGAITQGNNMLVVGGNFIQAGGTFNSGVLMPNPGYGQMTVAGDFIQTGGAFGGGDCSISVTGAFTLSSGTFTAPSADVAVTGDFTHSGGTFTHNGSTVRLNGANQTIAGDTTFYNLVKQTKTADTLTFTGGTRQAVTNNLVLQGKSGQVLSVVSSADGTQWEIDPLSTRTIEYTAVKDSGNVNATGISADPAINTDSGNNTGWTFAPPSTDGWVNGQNAVNVLGQPGFTTGTGGVSDKTFDYPKDMVLDLAHNKLYVVDYNNHRVLRFAYPITGNQPAAELVFGQPDMDTNKPGNETDCTAAGGTWYPPSVVPPNGYCTALTYPTGRNTFSSPAALAIDDTGRLWVVDRGNHRIVWFDNAYAITSNQPDADGVLGQSDFTTDTAADPPTRSSLNVPFGITLDSYGNLYVADSMNHRVLRFDNAVSKGNGANADAVFGQPDFTSKADNNGGISASTMFRPLATYMYGTYLFVSDRSNGRVLRFDNAAAKGNGVPADRVLGQPDFTTASHVIYPADRDRIEYCGKMEVDGSGNLYVSDGFHNERVLIFNNVLSKGNGAAADNVLGQGNYTDSVPGSNSNPPTQSNLNLDSSGGGMAIDNIRNLLFVADELYNRIMIFKKNVVGPEFNLKQGGTYCPGGTTFDFGTRGDGGETVLTFYIENPGDTDLTLGGSPVIAITGADADQFRVKTQPTTPVASEGSTSFQVAFAPTSQGAKSAGISIVNNDADENPFNLIITGTSTVSPPPTPGPDPKPPTQYTVTFDLDSKGEHTGGGALVQTVPKGSSATAPAVQANTGYVFDGWDKAFTNVQSNMTVIAQYTSNGYTLSYTAGQNGSVTGSTEQSVESGAAGTPVTAVPDDKYLFVSWSDGSTDNPRTDTNVMSDISVSASFKLKSVDAPSATLSDIPNSTTNTGSYRIIIGGIGVETYRYSLDSGAWSREISVGQPLTFALSEDGKHTLSVTGRNSDGIWQAQADATVFEWILDTTPPRAGMFNAPSGTVGATSIEVKVGGEDVKTYRYRLDSGEWSGILSVSAPVTAADLGEGVHTLEVIGADA
ncbi:MAG: choice-of-anchor D domain-containing protein, partial [Desulfobacteraceae bacterium]|nr:choice-of-anchor D domain-containing protein [Desulfobacteraceae bacterium]